MISLQPTPEENREPTRKEYALARQASLLHAALESTADGILVIDRAGRIVQYNSKFIELWKIPREIMERREDDLVIEFVLAQLKDPEAFLQRIRELYEYTDTESDDLLDFKDGSVFERSSRPQRLGNEIIGRVWSFRDITKQKQAEKAIRDAHLELNQILASISDCVWSAYVEEGAIRYRFYSPPIEKITGRPPSFYMEGPERWLSTLFPEDLDLVHAAIVRLTNRQSRHEVTEYRVYHTDGSIRYVRDSINAYDCDGSRLRIDGVSSDITDQKFLEAHKQTLLEHESTLRIGAEEEVRERDLFISIASHELKNPLNNLQLRIDLLSRAIQGMNEAKDLKVQLQGCKKNLERFDQLINELLDFSKIKASGCELNKRSMNLPDLIKDLATQFAPQFEQQKCTLRTAIDDELIGIWDKVKMGQVVTNLISNALKYAPGTEILVTLHRVDDRAVLTVRDHGKGMSKESTHKIFQPYSRVAKDASVGGLGLGLYISKKIVDAHSGNISVECEVGKGCEFKVELPIEA